MTQEEAEKRRDERQAIAVFRYGVIADLVAETSHRGLYAKLGEKAAREYAIPGSLRRKIAAETLRGWLRAYRRGGFDALVPRMRADQGSARAIPPALVDLLCQMKEDEPKLSVPLLMKKVREEHAHEVGETVLAPSTVHRLLARRGLMKEVSEGAGKDRRRFEYALAGELWMSDVMHGPKLREGGRQRKTYLIAMIDDATRILPYASFAFSEGAVAYLAVLEKAVRRRGIPKRLYVDNGSAFRSQHLAVVCAKLGISLIHARPYSPQGKGKIERLFRTVRMQFLPSTPARSATTLEELNRALAAWVEGEYHLAPHRGLGDETPADKWARTSEDVQMPTADVGEHFLAEQRRKVQRDRTVTLDGVAYEADASLIGERVMLRYDAARRPDKRTVEVWHRGKRVEIAKRVDVLANCHVKRHGSSRELVLPRETAGEIPGGMSMRALEAGPSDDGDEELPF
ncbi:MAG: DDE-type integrase/transposase/recombinase [Gammaproteobacteria bacterium]|nr:DDE-type integrase/transposase/recombinase [Gammaproteobacteria bacterium]